jgi:hypothetical protein
MVVTPAGGKFWRWSYRFHGTEQFLSLGEYPEMGLADARVEHEGWQKVLSSGLNPAAEKKKGKEHSKLQMQRLAELRKPVRLFR